VFSITGRWRVTSPLPVEIGKTFDTAVSNVFRPLPKRKDVEKAPRPSETHACANAGPQLGQ